MSSTVVRTTVNEIIKPEDIETSKPIHQEDSNTENSNNEQIDGKRREIKDQLQSVNAENNDHEAGHENKRSDAREKEEKSGANDAEERDKNAKLDAENNKESHDSKTEIETHTEQTTASAEPTPKTSPFDTLARRVKLYTLSEDKWIDCGTGYCSGKVFPNPHIHVINELNPEEILLDSAIQGATQYQRQQDTLIVWTNEDGMDYALSFQEYDSCLELCDFLTKIQTNKIAPNISLVAVIQSGDGEITEMIAGPIPELPVPNSDNLADILDILTINKFRNNLITGILSDNGEWMRQLTHVFQECEEKHRLLNIYCLTDIIKTLIYFNEIDIFELIVSEDFIYSIVGILEYEPEFPGMKLNWREFLTDKVQVKQVIAFENAEIKAEIRKCFVLKFLKDAVLARLLDDSGFNCLSTMIQNKESKVLEFIQSDEKFLDDLFALYPIQGDKALKSDGIKLIHEFVSTSKSSQQYQRSEFFKCLVDKGLMAMIKYSMDGDDKSGERGDGEKSLVQDRILMTEVIVTIIEHDISIFKSVHEEVLLSILINILVKEHNVGLKTQAFEAIKLLLDPYSTLDPDAERPRREDGEGVAQSPGAVDGLFLAHFYRQSAHELFQPIISLLDDSCVLDHHNRLTLVTLEYLCELLSFISKFHDGVYSRPFILHTHVLRGVARMISDERFKFQLRLSAIRCLRTIVISNDGFYTDYIIENNILAGFMHVVHATSHCDNLVSSTCLHFLNAMLENASLSYVQPIIDHLVSRYSDVLAANLVGVKMLQLRRPLAAALPKGTGLGSKRGVPDGSENDGGDANSRSATGRGLESRSGEAEGTGAEKKKKV